MLVDEIAGHRELVRGKRLVILHVGTNDVANGVYIDRLCDMLKRLREMVLSISPQTRVVISGLLPRLDDPAMQNVVKQVNRKMKRWLRVNYLHHKRFVHANQPVANVHSHDGLHLNAEGKRLLWLPFANLVCRS